MPKKRNFPSFKIWIWVSMGCLCSQVRGQQNKLQLVLNGSDVVLHYTLERNTNIATIFETDTLSPSQLDWTPILSFPVSRSWDANVIVPRKGLASAVHFFSVASKPLGILPNMVWIAPGTFTIGSPPSEPGRYADEGPQREVVIGQGFWLSKYELTQREYAKLMGNNPSYATGDEDQPVESVDWEMAMAYCVKLTERERAAGRLPPGYVYRLPTEAEWEYACRAGSKTRYHFGDDAERLSDYAWWSQNGGAGPHSVGLKLPNPWGLYDMHGNVFEWCLDRYVSYSGELIRGDGSYRVKRSGAFYCPNYVVRAACRFESARPTDASKLVGFRVALGPVQALLDALAPFPTPATSQP